MQNPQVGGCQGPALAEDGPESRCQRQVNIAILNLHYKRVFFLINCLLSCYCKGNVSFQCSIYCRLLSVISSLATYTYVIR